MQNSRICSSVSTVTGRRRRRETEVTVIEIEIINQPTSDGQPSDDDLSLTELQEVASQLVNAAALNVRRAPVYILSDLYRSSNCTKRICIYCYSHVLFRH